MDKFKFVTNSTTEEEMGMAGVRDMENGGIIIVSGNGKRAHEFLRKATELINKEKESI